MRTAVLLNRSVTLSSEVTNRMSSQRKTSRTQVTEVSKRNKKVMGGIGVSHYFLSAIRHGKHTSKMLVLLVLAAIMLVALPELSRASTHPELLSLRVNGDTVTMDYDRSLQTSPLPDTTDFSVDVYDSAGNASTPAVSSVSIANSTVILTLVSAVAAGDEVYLRYTPGTNPIQDSSGNQAAEIYSDTVKNNTDVPADSTPPTITLTNPTEGDTVSGSVTLTATATDDVAIERVDFLVNGTRVSTESYSSDGAGTYSYGWDSTSQPDGPATITARAYDTYGNFAGASNAVTVDNPPDTTIDAGPIDTSKRSTATFEFSSSKTGSTFECRLDAGAWESCASPKSYSSLSNAVHTFEVRASDSVGKTDASPASRTWTVDASGIVVQETSATLTPHDLAHILVGPQSKVQITNVTHKGADLARGKFEGGADIIGFEGGIILSSGDIYNNKGSNSTPAISHDNGMPGDADLDVAAGASTNDASVLEFDIVPTFDKISVQYVFASEEYNEFVGSSFNDVFGFYVNGNNCAKVGTSAVSVNTINLGSNADRYRDNESGTINTEMDGLTTVLTCTATVTPGATSHIKLAIADASDSAWDSNVFLKSDSFQSFDDEAPTVSLTAPADGASVSGTVTLSADAADNMSVDRVEFLVNGLVAGTDASAPYSLQWDSTSVADGSVTISARAVDTSANSRTSAAHTVTVDNTAPDTTITSGPTGTVTGTSATFGFTSSETGSTFECKLDTGDWQNCSSPKEYTGLAAGEHTFQARATDAAGNTDATAASRTWTITAGDTTAPAAPTVNLATTSDTGASDTDDVTSDDTPTFNGSAEANSTVKVYKGTTLLGTTTATSTGTWSFTAAALTDGTYSITATATDAAGNTSAATAVLSLVIDTAAPAAPEITSPANNSRHNTATITLSGLAERDSTVEIFEGTTSKGSTTAILNGSWSKDLAAVADGSHSYTATATDLAGNTSAVSAALTVIVDTNAPTISSVTPEDTATDVVVSANIEAIFSEAMDAATLTDTSFTLVADGMTTAITATVTYDAASKTATLNPSADLDSSTLYTATISGAKDLAGNALAADKVWTFTTASPDEVPSLLAATVDGSTLVLDYSEFLDEDSVPDAGDFVVKVNGVAQAAPSLVSVVSDAVTIMLDKSVLFGDTVVVSYTPGTAQLRDLTGNNAAALTDEPVENNTPDDNTSPTVALTAPAAGAVVNGSVTITADATDNVEMDRVEFIVDGVVIGTDSDESDGFSISWNSADVADGSHTIIARAYDTSSKQADSTGRTVTVDNTAPTVTGVTPANAATNVALDANATATFSEAMDASTLTATSFVLVQQGTTSAVAATVTYDAASKTVTLNPSANLAGNVTYTATVKGGVGGVKDAAGNPLGANKVWSFTTLNPDTTKPSVSITAPASGAWVKGTVAISANATDNVGVTKVEFLVGTTVVGSDNTAPYSINWNTTTTTNGAKTITAKAYDAAGNTQTNSRTVTVDNTRPVVSSVTQSLALNQRVKTTLAPPTIPVKVS